MDADISNISARLKISNEVLGSGGFARVFRAELDGKIVALKVLHPQWCDPNDGRCRAFQQHFIKEGRFLAKTKHANIVSCMGIVQLPPNHPGLPKEYANPVWGMVLELCKGGAVSRLVMKQMTEPFARIYTDFEALSWMIDIAEALVALHSLPEPVLHRDLKLENILLMKENLPSGKVKTVAKLADFGLHVILNSETKGRVLRRRSVGLSHQVSVTSSVGSHQGSFRRPSLALAVPRVANDDIKEESSNSSDDDDILQLRAKMTPSPKEVGAAEDSAPQCLGPQGSSGTTDPLPQVEMSHSSRTSSLATKRSGALSPESSVTSISAVSPIIRGPPSTKCPISCPPLRPLSKDLQGEDGSSPKLVPATSPAGLKKMRASEGNLDVTRISKPERSMRMTAQDGDLTSPASDSAKRTARRMGSETNVRLSRSGKDDTKNPPSRRQSDYNMIFSFEKPSVVQNVIQRVLASKYEVAYQLTGETGSAIYMSPEVHRHEPYNEKTDVYSFGVMLFETFSRNMLLLTDAAAQPDAYAQRVATGFRPSKPEKMDPELYDLIEWCWKQDPNERPQMKDVMECLIAIKANMEEAEEARRIRRGGGGCGCVIS